MRISAGMSGYSYKEWKGDFYPADLPADRMLAHYATRFPVVELNNTFYRMPSERQLLDWAGAVPDGFRFALKASRRITHNHRLKDASDLVDYVVRNAAVLGDRLGPMLFQLPPTLRKDLPRLEQFLRLLPRGWQAAFEWRHPSWFDEEVEALLRTHGAACVVAQTDEGETPLMATTSWGYVRLHGSGYTGDRLRDWVARIRDQPWEECVVFFKHEEDIAGPSVALEFMELLG